MYYIKKFREIHCWKMFCVDFFFLCSWFGMRAFISSIQMGFRMGGWEKSLLFSDGGKYCKRIFIVQYFISFWLIEFYDFSMESFIFFAIFFMKEKKTLRLFNSIFDRISIHLSKFCQIFYVRYIEHESWFF